MRRLLIELLLLVKFFAILMAIFGIYVGNLWFPIIALFIYVGASEEEQSTKADIALGNVPSQRYYDKECGLCKSLHDSGRSGSAYI